MKKLYITLVGRRNSGKSSLINVITGQDTAIVSHVPGTTTDPVKKSYEIPGLTSVVFTDTAGIDDSGTLGAERVRKTEQAILQADAVIVVIDGSDSGQEDEKVCEYVTMHRIPFIIVWNKTDIKPLKADTRTYLEKKYRTALIPFSAKTTKDASAIIEALGKLPVKEKEASLIGDLVKKGDIILLVAPIDSEAPAGRLILPQVQTIRDVLDNHCTSIVLQPEELPLFLSTSGITPGLVITDSQVFKKVSQMVPPTIPLTSFSILMARRKGNFEKYVEGTREIDRLKEGDHVLILESCSHHTSCEDIGRVKIPALLKQYTGKELTFDFISGLDPIGEREKYALVLQCGGCMITGRQLHNRIAPFFGANIPVSNYGMAMAYCHGIFERSIEVFKH